MAFDSTKWAKLDVGMSEAAPQFYGYISATDNRATIKASAYFNDVGAFLRTGDMIYIVGSDDDDLLKVTSADATTPVTVSSIIDNSLLADLSVSTGKLIDLAVTGAKMANDTIATAKLNRDSDQIFAYSGNWKQTVGMRPTSDYAYFWQLDGDEYMTGGAAQKTYMMGVSADRPVGSAATGDSNDAIFKGSYSNYAANDTNFIIRALNTSVTNRSGGTLGTVEGCSLGVKNQGTTPTLRGVTIRAENYSTNATEFGVLDVNCSDEVGAATLRYGARIRNTDASGVAAMGHGLLFSSTATNGFNNAITVQNKVDTFADFDDATGNVATETGSAATNWKFRIKVVSPDGTDCWINAYSTSNA